MTIMQNALKLCLTLLIMVGCTRTSSNNEALKVWRADSSSLESRLKAANILVPIGTKMVAVNGILGKETKNERWHGPALEGSKSVFGTNLIATTYGGHWRLLYEFSGGRSICLDFLMSESDSDQWPLLAIFVAQPSHGSVLSSTNK